MLVDVATAALDVSKKMPPAAVGARLLAVTVPLRLVVLVVLVAMLEDSCELELRDVLWLLDVLLAASVDTGMVDWEGLLPPAEAAAPGHIAPGPFPFRNTVRMPVP